MEKPRASRPLNPQIRAEATDWLLRFSEGEVGTAAREEFNDWLRTSPEHVRAYLRVSAFWQEAGHIDGKQGPRDIEVLVARARNDANVVPLALGSHFAEEAAGHAAGPFSRPGTRSFVQPRRWLIAVAATLVAATGAVGIYEHLAGDVYETRIGEQRTVNLPDGSTIILDADSRISVRYGDTERSINLEAGQALFKVASNPARPFIVRSGETSVRAVGTQFDVYRRTTGTTVTVVEGKVAVVSGKIQQAGGGHVGPSRTTSGHAPGVATLAPVFLAAGEQLTIPEIVIASAELPAAADTPSLPVVRSVSVEQATAWTDGLLMFEGAPLAEVVREFNRQNTRRLVLEDDPELTGLMISGTFPASGSERIVRFLQERFGVVVHETGDEIKLSRE
jgi:transmembrane sensor